MSPQSRRRHRVATYAAFPVLIATVIGIGSATATGAAPATGLRPNVKISAVSCPTVRFCAASTQGGAALEYRRGRWTTPVRLWRAEDQTWTSCGSRHFCIAVGDPGWSRWNGHRWSAVHRDIFHSGKTRAVFASIACTSRKFCAASSSNGQVATFDGRRWSRPRSLFPTEFTTVACTGRHFCFAVSGFGATATYNGRRWTHRRYAPNRDSATYYAAACATRTACFAATDTGRLATFNGSHWTSDRRLATSSGPFPFLSCTSARFCMYAHGRRYARYDGKRWIAGTARIRSKRFFAFFGMGCATRTFCVAGGGGPGSAAIYRGTTWTART